MQLMDVIPPRLRPHWQYPQVLSRWQFGAERAMQLLGLVVVAVVMIPIGVLVLRAAGAGTEGLDYLLRPRALRIIGNSVSLMLAATALATAIALPFAWLTARCDLPGRRLWLALGLAAMVIPSYLVAVTYSEALGPRGILQGLLEPFGVDRLPGIKGFVGATLVLGVVSFPYIALPLRAAILQCDRSLEEAGHSLGLGSWGVFRQITVPQLRPALSTGMLLAALYILSDFGAVAVMQYNAFTRAIFLQTESFRMDKASLLALALIFMALALLFLQARAAGAGRRYRIGSGASRQLEIIRLGKWRYPALLFCGVVALAGLVIPVVVLFSWLVGRQMSNPVQIPLSQLTGSTVGVSVVAALVVSLAALPLALLAMRRAKRINRWLVNIAYAGNVLPGIVIALALVAFASQNLLSLYQTLPLLILGYAVRYLPLSIGATESAFAQINPRYEEAGRSMGLGRLEVLARITVPLARGGILAGMALVFLNVMKELPSTLILRPIGFRTFATRIWSAYDEAFLATIAVPGLALILVSALALLIVLHQEDILD
ncbi:MAG: iron ABC transporter permease [Chloroflexi bacterium]|nr:iron ABC transporter permease [Chloroflexota bacterium]